MLTIASFPLGSCRGSDATVALSSGSGTAVGRGPPRGLRGPDRAVVIVSIRERSGARSRGENIELLQKELARCFPRPHPRLSQPWLPAFVRRVRPASDRRRPPAPLDLEVQAVPRRRPESRRSGPAKLMRYARSRNIWFGDGDEVVCHDLLLSFDDPIMVPACVESHLQSPRECRSHPPGSHLQAAPGSRAGSPANLDS